MNEKVLSSVIAFAAEHGFAINDGEPALEKLSGGNSHVTWQGTFAGSRLVIKVAQPDVPLAPYDVGHEARMMQLAWEGAVPAPQVVGYCQQHREQCIVMHHVAGDAPSLWEVAKWLGDKETEERLAIARNFLSLLPTMHAVVLENADPLERHYQAYVEKLVRDLEDAARNVINLPRTFRKARDWLIANAKLCEGVAPRLHHGDFRLGNAVFADDAVVAMLDWERAMAGHPMHDLGFLCLPGMKIGDRICGLLSQDELRALWPEISDEPFNLKTIGYFRIMSMFSELCYMTRAMCRLAEGRARLSGARALPLIARLHHDLIASIIAWENDDVTL